jgi:hypothetical protein
MKEMKVFNQTQTSEPRVVLTLLTFASFVNFMHHMEWVLTPLTSTISQASPKLTFPLLTKARTKHHPSIGLFALKYLPYVHDCPLTYRTLMKP